MHSEDCMRIDLKLKNILFKGHPGYDLKHVLNEALIALNSPKQLEWCQRGVSDLGPATRISAEIDSAIILYGVPP